MKMEAKPGDLVKVNTISEEISGILMPGDEGYAVVKLESGYNIGIGKSSIKSIELVSKLEEKAHPAKKETVQKNLPKISILHTGGTIASKVDYRTGGVSARLTEEELLTMFPELREIASISSKLIRNMFSEDMRFAHYNIMAGEIEKELKQGAEGVIVTHGTDTLHYSAAALAFILEGLKAPVILVGAQRSSDRGSSDAGLNLISAAYFIANSDFAGVAICMHENTSDEDCLILPGLKSRKMHTSRRDAFRPVNTSSAARVNFGQKKISFFGNYQKREKGLPEIKPINEKLKIGILKAHPNMHAQEFSAYEGYDGLVVEGTGMGHAPINEIDEFTGEHKKILQEIARLAARMPVVMTPQTIYGRIQMDVYSTGRDLQSAGVLGNMLDMTPETAFIKLAWLLSNHPKEAKELIGKNIRGEITERTEDRTFLA